MLCNWLVCLAVFMATAARDVTGKLLACYLPIMAFVASGFEHSIANMYFIPTGLLLARAQGREVPGLTWTACFRDNLLPVTLGNILGGVLFVAFAYWYVHLKVDGRRSRSSRQNDASSPSAASSPAGSSPSPPEQ
ncbi:formate/nitrite transporter family protein [Citrifermentans bemidjiense]|nr:formate/nitrite transporter family protein [Citrifermentans bemidjiense]